MLTWHHPLWLLTITALAILFAIGLAAANPLQLVLHSLTVPGRRIPSHLLPTPGVLFPWDPKLPLADHPALDLNGATHNPLVALNFWALSLG